jgi:hypothetical protein
VARSVPSQIREFIAAHFPPAVEWVEASDRGLVGSKVTFNYLPHGPALIALRNLLRELPEELLLLGPTEGSQFTHAVASIDLTLEHWRAGDKGGGGTLYPLRVGPFSAWSPVALVYKLLEGCPDESPAPDTHELAFISDRALRFSLRLDVHEATRALAAGQWKSATVMAGSVVEAVLLAALTRAGVGLAREAARRNTHNPVEERFLKGTLESWSLYPMIAAAEGLEIISEDTAKLATIARGFRNLIHPGRAQRTGVSADKGTSYTALAAVERVVADVKRWAEAEYDGAI